MLDEIPSACLIDIPLRLTSHKVGAIDKLSVEKLVYMEPNSLRVHLQLMGDRRNGQAAMRSE